jgi:rhodanese-related sulfurtransferase
MIFSISVNLKEFLKHESNLVIVDVSKTKYYLENHIPGAVNGSFSAKDYISYGVRTWTAMEISKTRDNSSRYTKVQRS